MPSHFDRFRYLNGPSKRVENMEYQGHIRVKVDDLPEIDVPPGASVEIPEGEVIEFAIEVQDP